MTRPGSRNQLAHAEVDALLAAARRGDREAFGELFRRYRRYAYAVARSSGAGDVDEAVSESFRLVASAIDAGNGPTVAFGPYLATTVRSVARRQRQLASRQDVIEPAALESRLVADVSDRRADPVLAAAFATLPDRWQSVIWYVDIEGIPPRHVVDLVGVPSSNAASALLLRARAGLRVAYLDALVGEAHTPEVRAHLTGLIAGGASTDELDHAAQWHLERCPECRDLESRVAAIVGRREARTLAVSLVALMGFTPEADMIPAGTGLGIGGVAGGLTEMHWGWFSAAATTAVVGGVLLVTTWAGSGGGDGDASADAAASVVTVAEPTPEVSSQRASQPPLPAPPTSAPALGTEPESSSSSTSSTSSTSTSVAPPSPTVAPAPPPPPATDPPPPASEAPPASVPAAPSDSTTTSSTLPPDTTTSTTVPPDTTTTVAPDVPVGHLGGSWALLPNGVLHIDLVVDQLTGDPGRIVFSTPMVFGQVSGATCSSPTECTFSAVAPPAKVSIAADTEADTLSIQLFDSLDNLDDEGTAG